ncbi:hypothetical protein [Raineyella sp. LH-20]|uniref:hypothetical protein n=1 Tax=Raineyella sp. LH-20 TaxID=3081204 RepID=UPI00295490BF|nr:hypothetical protein [Raineyella sp. LH-20]WOP17715.1 hypothetical protein R0146_10660 [Raineyella sp. LH-20]
MSDLRGGAPAGRSHRIGRFRTVRGRLEYVEAYEAAMAALPMQVAGPLGARLERFWAESER